MMSLFGIKTLVAKKATNDLTSPLLSKYSDDTFATVAIPDKSHDEIKTKTKNIQLLTGALVAAVVTGGAISSMISFVMFPAVIVYVAGGVCLFSCPIVLYNERKIMSLTALRDLVNELRRQGDFLNKTIDETQNEIDDLTIVQTTFRGVQNEFEELAKAQNMSAEKIVDLVKENEEILESMRENLRQRIVQDVIGTVVRMKKDSDQKIDRVEAKLLALKIRVKLECYGIMFDEEKFLEAIALKPSFSGAISVVKKLLPIEYREGECNNDSRRRSPSLQFEDDGSLDEDDVYDMFYMSREEQKKRGSVLAVRAVFGECDAPRSKRVSLASQHGQRRNSTLDRLRLGDSIDFIVGGNSLFPLMEE